MRGDGESGDGGAPRINGKGGAVALSMLGGAMPAASAAEASCKKGKSFPPPLSKTSSSARTVLAHTNTITANNSRIINVSRAVQHLQRLGTSYASRSPSSLTGRRVATARECFRDAALGRRGRLSLERSAARVAVENVACRIAVAQTPLLTSRAWHLPWASRPSKRVECQRAGGSLSRVCVWGRRDRLEKNHPRGARRAR